MRRQYTTKLSFDQLEARRLLHGGPFGGHPGPDWDPPTVEERADGILDKLDANDNGELTADEASDGQWARLVKADANTDGIVTKDELVTQITAKREEFKAKREELKAKIAERKEQRITNTVDRVFSALDENENGLLTQDEVSERRWNRLSAADTDGTAGVSPTELAEQLGERHRPGRHARHCR